MSLKPNFKKSKNVEFKNYYVLLTEFKQQVKQVIFKLKTVLFFREEYRMNKEIKNARQC